MRRVERVVLERFLICISRHCLVRFASGLMGHAAHDLPRNGVSAMFQAMVEEET
jgi:hypothetical protein